LPLIQALIRFSRDHPGKVNFPNQSARRRGKRVQQPSICSAAKDDWKTGEEVLPLSNIPAIVPPFFLAPNEIFALES
jgi:hypothetical protein